MKNCLTVTLLSVGMPMLLMGDEVRRTQGGTTTPLPGQRDELVRLDAGGEACRCPPVRDPVQRATAVARLGAERRLPLELNLLRGAKQLARRKLGQPDWRECSHSMAFTAEIRQEQLCST